jgi:ATP-dependent RNA helicase DeaD
MQAETNDLPTFDALPLSSEVRRAVDELGYVHPTPVQTAVFEPASRGKDLVVQARTGTGKTAAFGLPLVDGIVKRGVAAVQALVLSPTRELALQINREIDALSKHRGVRCTAVYGGAPMARQVTDIRAGAQIVVGTPGRVLDHLHRGTIDPASIRCFVLDESDEMLSMGFLPQISDIMSFLPKERQTLLFSATLPPDIRRVAETRLKNPEFLTLSGDHIGALEIDHFVVIVPGDKVSALVQLIEVDNPESAIVFCNTKDETKRVAAALEQQGYAADWLNADLPQNDREKVMAATRKGELRFLVCTDVASRGIDISHLTHVINYDFPESAEAYVHRTGRTGRAGRTGTALSLVGPRDVGNLYLLRLTYKVKPIERQLPSARDKKTREEADLIRMFTEAFASKPAHANDLALARRLLSHDQAEAIVAGLLRDHLGARPDAVDEATAARRAKNPPPVAEAKPPEAKAPEAKPREVKSLEAKPREVKSLEAKSPEVKLVDAPEAPRERPREARRDPGRDPTRGPREPRRGGRRDDAGGPRRNDGPSRRDDGDGGDDDLPRYTVQDSPMTERSGQTARPSAMPVIVEAPAPDPGDTPNSADEAPPDKQERSENELYVSVGRRDGAKPSDYHAVLEAAGITPEDLEYVRVRHRHAFVGLRPGALERALAVLNGAMIAGRRATAERARRD